VSVLFKRQRGKPRFSISHFAFRIRICFALLFPPRRMAIILKPENVAQFVFFVRGEKVMLLGSEPSL
jgi:hypothetical protein